MESGRRIQKLCLNLLSAALIRVLDERFRYCDVHVGQEVLLSPVITQGRDCGLMVTMEVMQKLFSLLGMLERGLVELGLR